MAKAKERRTVEDLVRALKSLSAHFSEDVFVVVGSQAGLVGWDSTPNEMRATPEIDVYLARVKSWEARHPGDLADFEIAGLFGQGSAFDQKYGFHIDGVSPETAALPAEWQTRAVYREIKHEGREIMAIAPCIEDLAISKMRRLAEKDREWVEACNRTRGLDIDLLKAGLASAPYEPAERDRTLSYLASLPSNPPKPIELIAPPPHPAGTHQAFWSKSGTEVRIRAYDEETGLFIAKDNPLGPAYLSASASAYYLDNKLVSEATWRARTEGGMK